MQIYHDLLKDVIDNGIEKEDRTGTGTFSVFGRQIRHDMREGFPLITTKHVPPRWVFEELRWFLSGSTDANVLKEAGVDIWDEWADAETCAKFGRKAGDLGPVYGHLWRNFDGNYGFDQWLSPGVDQIADLLHAIEHTPDSRRMIVSGWHPRKAKQVSLPPCHTLWQVYRNQNELSLQLYARSIDIFLGLPFNIASYGFLLEMLASVFNLTARDLIITFGDLHLYRNHKQQALTQLERKELPLPFVSLNKVVGKSPLKTLLSFEWKDVVFETPYRHLGKIPAPVAI